MTAHEHNLFALDRLAVALDCAHDLAGADGNPVRAKVCRDNAAAVRWAIAELTRDAAEGARTVESRTNDL